VRQLSCRVRVRAPAERARAWQDEAHAGCLECHGNPHGILPAGDSRSPVYPLRLPRTCGRCHGDAELAKRWGIADVYGLYIDSIHGFALNRAGLLVAATCSSCHTAHRILDSRDPESRTHRNHVPATCGSCHAGIEARYDDGVHGRALRAGSGAAPVCTDRHTVHQIARVEGETWQIQTVATCGACHEPQRRTYRDTLHGQVTALGFAETARCWTCHAAHEILPASDPRSQVAPQNRVATCGQCHRGVTEGFVSYQPHPDPHDRGRNPGLYYAALFMNGLLLSVFLFFGLHSILWLVRFWFGRRGEAGSSSSRAAGRFSEGRGRAMSPDAPTPAYYFRFTLGSRYLHGLLIACFLGLAATGMTLFFSSAPWAPVIAHGMGGFRAIYRHSRWFLWLGPKPRFDRYTYWEKFDYWAVFWGMVIIGVSILYRALIKREKGLFWGPDSMVPQPRDLSDLVRALLRPLRSGLRLQHRPARPRRRGTAGRLVHLHDPLVQHQSEARQVPDGRGDLHRQDQRSRAAGREAPGVSATGRAGFAGAAQDRASAALAQELRQGHRSQRLRRRLSAADRHPDRLLQRFVTTLGRKRLWQETHMMTMPP
jgi:hypothetical protein